MIESKKDLAEWVALEAERDAIDWNYPQDVAPRVSDKPHKKSYRPDLPLRGLGLGVKKPTHKWKLDASDRKADIRNIPRAQITIEVIKIAKDKPHPESYCATLPLRGIGLNRATDTRKWNLTADEKKSLANRPLILHKGQYNAV